MKARERQRSRPVSRHSSLKPFSSSYSDIPASPRSTSQPAIRSMSLSCMPGIVDICREKSTGRSAAWSDFRHSGLGFGARRSEEHTSELQSLMRISYAVFCLKKKKQSINHSHRLQSLLQKVNDNTYPTKNIK